MSLKLIAWSKAKTCAVQNDKLLFYVSDSNKYFGTKWKQNSMFIFIRFRSSRIDNDNLSNYNRKMRNTTEKQRGPLIDRIKHSI